MGWENDCFTRYIMLKTFSPSLSLKHTHTHTHTRTNIHTHTHTHTLAHTCGSPPFLFLRYLLSIYIFKIYVMYMYSIWKQIGNLQWSLSSSTSTARKHIHRSNLEGHIEKGREGRRESEWERSSPVEVNVFKWWELVRRKIGSYVKMEVGRKWCNSQVQLSILHLCEKRRNTTERDTIVCVSVWVCLCAYVCEREIKRKTQSERQKETDRESERVWERE